MKNPILEKIKKFAISELQREYKYCGVADSDNFAMLNSDDGKGNDITIKINSVMEE